MSETVRIRQAGWTESVVGLGSSRSLCAASPSGMSRTPASGSGILWFAFLYGKGRYSYRPLPLSPRGTEDRREREGTLPGSGAPKAPRWA
jgi:hypothetical protein